MLPTFATNDTGNTILPYSVYFAELGLVILPCRIEMSDFLDFFGSELGLPMAFSKEGHCSVLNCIPHVVLSGAPLQIAQPIISPNAVFVSALGTNGSRASECLYDQPVDITRPDYPVAVGMDSEIAILALAALQSLGGLSETSSVGIIVP